MFFEVNDVLYIRLLTILAFAQNNWRSLEFISGSHFLLKKQNHSKLFWLLLVDYPVTDRCSQKKELNKTLACFLGLDCYHHLSKKCSPLQNLCKTLSEMLNRMDVICVQTHFLFLAPPTYLS